MIFQTIKDEVTGANKSIGLLGLSLKDVDDKLYSIKTRGLKDTLFNTSTLDEEAITTYNNEIAKGATAQNALATASKNANRATIALMESANGTAISTEQMVAAQKASTVAARAQSAAYKAVSIAANMIAGIAISFAINAVVKAIDNLIHRTEKIKEAAEEAQQAIDDAQKTLQNVSTTISENKEHFLELSEGVSRFSKNLLLSEEDYKEYLSISQKLADISPELIVGYDEQGNALLDIGNNAEETTQKLNKLLETQQTISKQTLVDNLDAVAQGVYVEVNETKSSITLLKQQLEDAKKESSEINFDIADIVKNGNAIFQFNDINDPLKTYRTAFKKALKSANINWEDLGNDQIFVNDFSNAVGNGGKDGYEIRDIALKEAQEYYEALLNLEDNTHAASIAGLEKEIADKENAINASYSKMTANLQAWTEQNYNYQYLTDDSQDIIDVLIPNIDWDNLGIDLYSGQDYQQYITDHIITPLMSVPKEHKQEIDNMFQQLLSFKDGDLKVLDFAEKLQAKLDEYGIKIDITPIISDEKEVKNKLRNSVEAIAQGNDYFTSNGVQVDAEELKILQDYTKDFNAEQVELWNKVTLGAENAEEAIHKYEEALGSTFDNETTILLDNVEH